MIAFIVNLYQINDDIKNNSKKKNKILLKISKSKDKNVSNEDIDSFKEKYQKSEEREKKLYKKRKKALTNLISILSILILLCVLRFKPINTSSGESAEYFSNLERKFTSENENHLSSDLWDEIIDGRKELFKSHPNGSLAWLLANQMQTYALNYLNQTKNGDNVLYFYFESIKDT